MPPQTNRLKDLQWLVGDWASAATPVGITMHTTCDWTANQAFLIRKFKVEGKEAMLRGGTEVIGWDPRGESFRSGPSTATAVSAKASGSATAIAG